jgi:hypothetical protein
MVVKIFRVFDSVNIHNMLALHGGTRFHGINRGRFFWNLNKFAPRILASFGLGQIAVSYVEDLSRKPSVNLQSSTEGIIKSQKNPVKE